MAKEIYRTRNLHILLRPITFRANQLETIKYCVAINKNDNHTWPLVEPSWADFPLTLKLTPLGALDWTSIRASSCQLQPFVDE